MLARLRRFAPSKDCSSLASRSAIRVKLLKEHMSDSSQPPLLVFLQALRFWSPCAGKQCQTFLLPIHLARGTQPRDVASLRKGCPSSIDCAPRELCRCLSPMCAVIRRLSAVMDASHDNVLHLPLPLPMRAAAQHLAVIPPCCAFVVALSYWRTAPECALRLVNHRL